MPRQHSQGKRGTLIAVTTYRRLPHDGGLQPQAEAAPAGAAPKEALQALGTELAKGSGLGTRSGIVVSPVIPVAFEPVTNITGSFDAGHQLDE